MNRTYIHKEYLDDRLITCVTIHVPETVAGVTVDDQLILRAAGFLIYRDCLQFGLQASYQPVNGVRRFDYIPEPECLEGLSTRELHNIMKTMSGH